jgi:lambda repressor-like predicted transcriptional regulator
VVRESRWVEATRGRLPQTEKREQFARLISAGVSISEACRRVEPFEQIRRDHQRDGLSIYELSRRHGVHRRTVRRALDSPFPPARKTHVQQVMRHRQITTTGGYLRPRTAEMFAKVHQHYTRPKPPPPPAGWLVV